MRVVIITKEFGTISTASVPYSEEEYNQLKSDMESLADTVGKESCESWSFEDDKGNTFILSPELLKKALFMIEINPGSKPIPTPKPVDREVWGKSAIRLNPSKN